MGPAIFLLVDDNPDNLFALGQLIAAEMPDAEIVTAAAADEAVRLAREKPIDLALIDVRMPQTSGIDLCRQLRADPAVPRFPILLITAMESDAELRAAGLDAGAEDFLSKPIDRVELIAKVRVMLRIKRTEDQLRTLNADLEALVASRTQALHESEERFRNAILNAPIPVMMHTEDGEVLQINKVWTELTGYSPNEIPTLSAWIQKAHRPQSATEAIQAVSLHTWDERACEGERRILTRDGEERVWEFSSSPAGCLSDGRRLIVRMAVDTTERRRAECALEETNRQLEALATTDDLTGLHNRRRFLETLNAEFERGRRYATPPVLAMFDVDHFKTINDAHGHAFGDQVLKRIAEDVRHSARTTDTVARYGGDEFLLLMPNTAVPEALSVVERIRRHAAQAPITGSGQTVQVTLSAGVAEADPAAGETTHDLLRKADEALQTAKAAGRDCAKVWGLAASQPLPEGQAEADVADRLRRRLGGLVQQSVEMFVQGVRDLVRGLEARVPYFSRHSGNTTHYALAVTEALGLGSDQVEDIRKAALVHDIGNVAVPRAILNSGRSLDMAERQIVEQHVVISVRLLDQLAAFDRAIPIVRHHHERWDGCGYPDGLSGEAIPLGARVLAVADAFDAMITGRAYRKPCRIREALGRLRRESGQQFDPAVVDALAQWVGDAPPSPPSGRAAASRHPRKTAAAHPRSSAPREAVSP
jgi:diguanylate cyclase (GGDEF)-like protein/PAS domain S-box-containing protein/putative nucleotidyltransferase with HDIG domain